MKVSKLIEELQKCNPEAEVITQTGPIYFLDPKRGYYDGHTPMLIQDHSNDYYNIVGYKFTPCVEKVVIQSMSLEDCLSDLRGEEIDNFPVEGSQHYIEYANKLKQDQKDFNKQYGFE